MPADPGSPHGESLEQLRARTHTELQLVQDRAADYPCILVDGERFARIVAEYEKGPLAVNVNLDILRDYMGSVFVDVKFSADGMRESFLIDAAKETWFFQALACSTMVGISSKRHDGRMFAVQLPKPDAAKEALVKITAGLGGK